MKPVNSTLSRYGTTIFTVMSALASEHGAVNLGQGFPDDGLPPSTCWRAPRKRSCTGQPVPADDGPCRAAPGRGRARPPLLRPRGGLADRRSMVTSGATEALAACFLGLHRAGRRGGRSSSRSTTPTCRSSAAAAACPRFVPLQPPDWRLDRRRLERLLRADKLRGAQRPAQPRGQGLSPERALAPCASASNAHDAYAVCDEVYEHVVFDGEPHVPLITLPGMRGALRQDRLRRQDLLADRLEGRLGHRRAPLIEPSPARISSSPSPRPPICRRRCPSRCSRIPRCGPGRSRPLWSAGREPREDPHTGWLRSAVRVRGASCAKTLSFMAFSRFSVSGHGRSSGRRSRGNSLGRAHSPPSAFLFAGAAGPPAA